MTASAEKIVIDLNDLFPAKASIQTVREKIAAWDVAPYKDRPVEIRGCSPTWAHLMVAGKLFGEVSSITFLMDDAKGGVPIPVYSRP